MRHTFSIQTAQQARDIIQSELKRDSAHAMSNLAKMKSLRQFIFSLEMFDASTSFKTRVHCFMHDCCKTSPKCCNPNCTNDVDHEVLTYELGFKKYCSVKCGNSDSSKKARMRATNLKKYGVENVFQTEDVKMKSCTTKTAKYGDPHYNNQQQAQLTAKQHAADNPDYYAEIQRKRRATNIANGHAADYTNQAQAQATYRKHAEEDPSFKQSIISKSRATKQLRHGDPNYSNRPKAEKTKLERYGTASYVNIEKMRQTKLELHGDPSWSNSAKARQTYFEKTGYRCAFENPDAQHHHKYTVAANESQVISLKAYSKLTDNKMKQSFTLLKFDSVEEIAYFLWLRESKVKFTVHPSPLKFEFRGKMCKYFPDFEVNGTIVEIKGDHFFRPDGTMFCPWRQSSWSDEKYKTVCELYEAKHQCMLRNNVTLILSSTLKPLVKQMLRTYGRDFIGQCMTRAI